MSNINCNPDDLLFIGTKGHVLALYKDSGEIAWTTSLPKTGYSVVAILPEGGALHCASGGHAFALDPRTGEILWTNGLKGMGQGIVYLATMQSGNTEGMAMLAAQAAANDNAAASSSTAT